MNVNLQWNRNVEPDVSGYNVYRGTHTGGPYTKVNGALVAQPPPGARPTYIDSSIPSGTYFYVVRAINPFGESADSNEVMVQPSGQPPSPPTGLVAQVSVGVSLAVDGVPAAQAEGSTPLALDYILPKSTPPRDRKLSMRVVA